jgi:hypothetical protein
MAERSATHLKACCILAERAWAVLNRGTPYVICDNHGNSVTPAEAKKIIAERWTVPKKYANEGAAARSGKAPQPNLTRPDTRGDPRAPDRRDPGPRQSTPPPKPINQPPASNTASDPPT